MNRTCLVVTICAWLVGFIPPRLSKTPHEEQTDGVSHARTDRRQGQQAVLGR
jgi:hypothetical protein